MRGCYDMQRNYPKNNAYYRGKNEGSQEFVHQHMSNHYRRVSNAKKVIDTSPPYCFKQRKQSIVNKGISTAHNYNYRTKQPFVLRNVTPPHTDRSISSNSNKDSFRGPYPSSRYHVNCIDDSVNPNINKKHGYDKNLVDLITYDTKYGPFAFCGCNWSEGKSQPNNTSKTPRNAVKENESKVNINVLRESSSHFPIKENEARKKESSSLQHNHKRISMDLSVKHNHCFTSPHSYFKPRILKTNAVSKLRGLRVYNPPRKRERPSKTCSVAPLECLPQNYKCKYIKTSFFNAHEAYVKKIGSNNKEQCQSSSRDSAYNGGVSSLPESRSPTPDQKIKKDCVCAEGDERYACQRSPDQRKKKDCVCTPGDDRYACQRSPDQRTKKECVCTVGDDRYTCQRKITDVACAKNKENFKVIKDPESNSTSRNVTPRETELKCISTCEKRKRDNIISRKMKEDAKYIEFIQDITVEILEKNLYTNKALKRVMKRHMLKKMGILNKERMLKEVENLRVQIGIPEDKAFFESNLAEIESVSDLTKEYSIISDSEFVLPENLDTNKKKNVVKVESPTLADPNFYQNCTSSNAEDKGEPHILYSSDSENSEESLSDIQEKKNTETRKEDSGDESPKEIFSQENISKYPNEDGHVLKRNDELIEVVRETSATSCTCSEVEEEISGDENREEKNNDFSNSKVYYEDRNKEDLTDDTTPRIVNFRSSKDSQYYYRTQGKKNHHKIKY